MPKSASDYQAERRYKKKAIKQIAFCLNRNTDEDIILHLDKIENVQGYLKRLVREGIEKGDDHDCFRT